MSIEPENNAIAPVQPEQRALRPVMFYLIVGIVFVADQVSKAWIQKTMLWEETRPLLGNAFQLTLTRNTGGAWGLLPNGNPLFIVFAIIAVCALLFAYHRMPRIDLLVGTAFALALGGALGNLTDRLHYHYVVDFFDARIIRFPIFNIADSAITLGIVFLLIHFLRNPRQEESGALGATVALATDDSSNRSEQKF